MSKKILPTKFAAPVLEARKQVRNLENKFIVKIIYMTNY